eukprot:RCo001544
MLSIAIVDWNPFNAANTKLQYQPVLDAQHIASSKTVAVSDSQLLTKLLSKSDCNIVHLRNPNTFYDPIPLCLSLVLDTVLTYFHQIFLRQPIPNSHDVHPFGFPVSEHLRDTICDSFLEVNELSQLFFFCF